MPRKSRIRRKNNRRRTIRRKKIRGGTTLSVPFAAAYGITKEHMETYKGTTISLVEDLTYLNQPAGYYKYKVRNSEDEIIGEILPVPTEKGVVQFWGPLPDTEYKLTGFKLIKGETKKYMITLETIE
jgi:hypothetical protein